MDGTSFDRLFFPESIAIIGAPSADDEARFLKYLQVMDFEGDIYPVNPNSDEIRGLEVYDDIREVPGTVDLAIVKLPRTLVPEVVGHCGEAGVRFAHIFTGGFDEANDDLGMELDAELRASIAEHETRVIGPNCVGIYSPGGRVPFIDKLSPEVGPVGLVSQSGGIATDICRHGLQHGVRFSKVVTVGNMVDVNHVEMLEALYRDDETEVVLAYLEGVRSASEGRELFELFDEYATRKPTFVLKGGRTETGARAASSHTGALAGDYEIWQSVFEQTRCIEVENFDELLNAGAASMYWDHGKTDRGSGVGLVGHGGGLSVTAVDKANSLGLRIPELEPSIVEQFESLDIATEIATIRNPVDIPDILAITDSDRLDSTRDLVSDVVTIVSEDRELGSVLMYLNIQNIQGYGTGSELYHVILDGIIDASADLDDDLDFGVVLRSNEEPDIVDLFQAGRGRLLESDIPVFNGLDQGLTAISQHRAFRRM